jgi:hypothetical protein
MEPPFYQRDASGRPCRVVWLIATVLAALAAALVVAACGATATSSSPSSSSPPWPASGRQSSAASPGALEAPGSHPILLLTQPQIADIRRRIAQGVEPQASAWRYFANSALATAMAAGPNVYGGPYRGGSTAQARLALAPIGTDGAEARDLGIAYAMTGDATYAAKAREFLVAWAQHNVPTTIGDYNSMNTGQLQAPGDFSFAYAYDLTYDSRVYTSADRAAIASWFARSIAALQGCLAPTLNSYFFLHPDTTPPYAGTYDWNHALHYSEYDALVVGADFPVLIQTASLAMGAMIGDTAVEQTIMNDPANPLNITKMEASALTPHNDGDGTGTDPVPQEKIYKAYADGRGGMFDYMTYNTRTFSVIVDMAANLGWGADQVSAARAKLHTSWSYIARYFAPGARPDFNPTDHINLAACLPRFALPWSEFGDARFAQVLQAGPWQTYYEPQLLGPVMVTNGLGAVP